MYHDWNDSALVHYTLCFVCVLGMSIYGIGVGIPYLHLNSTTSTSSSATRRKTKNAAAALALPQRTAAPGEAVQSTKKPSTTLERKIT